MKKKKYIYIYICNICNREIQIELYMLMTWKNQKYFSILKAKWTERT